MKHKLFLILGYYLYFQAAIAAVSVCSSPENVVILLGVGTLSALGGYKLISLTKPNTKVLETQPIKELDAPETQPLDKP